MNEVHRHLIYHTLLHRELMVRQINPEYVCDCRKRNPLSDRCLHDVYTPNLSIRDFEDIQKRYGMSEKQIRRMQFRSAPSPIVKSIIATDYSKQFELHRVPGFYYWEQQWHLLIPPYIHFLRPYYNGTRLIQGFLLYRDAASQPELLHSTGKPHGARAVPYLPEMEMAV